MLKWFCGVVHANYYDNYTYIYRYYLLFTITMRLLWSFIIKFTIDVVWLYDWVLGLVIGYKIILVMLKHFFCVFLCVEILLGVF